MNKVTRLIYLRNHTIIGWFCRVILLFLGVEIPPSVKIGRHFCLKHNGFGTVIHPCTTIGNNVTLYHGVTLGRADAHVPFNRSKFQGFKICDGALVCAGSVILCKEGVLEIGKGSIVGANSLLLHSIGPKEIWAGAPAKLIRTLP